MSYSSSDIVSKVIAYASGRGEKKSAFYVGITDDPDRRIIDEHNVLDDDYICLEAIDIDHARDAEKNLLRKRMTGGGGGGDDDSVFVYCYLITNDTKQ